MECLAVVKAIDYFTIHLLGQQFTVVMDQHALVALRDSGRLNGHLMSRVLALQAYDFSVKYRPGVLHQKTMNYPGIVGRVFKPSQPVLFQSCSMS